MRLQGTTEEVPASMRDICIYTRMHGSDIIWKLVIGGQPTFELSRDDICDMKEQMADYVREDGRDDLLLKTLAGIISIPRGRVYAFEMECTSVLSLV